MPASRSKLRPDANEVAFRTLQAATGEGERPRASPNPEAVARGRKGGKKGGKARAKKLTPRARSRIARKAASARWKRA